MARVVVTGASGFVGQNLVLALKARGGHEVIALGRDSVLADLHGTAVDHILHLAGANRPPTDAGFQADNVNYARQVLDTFVPSGPGASFHYASTVKVTQDSPYGRSKRAGEDLVRQIAPLAGWATMIWRLPNLFGKWGRPHYNSFVPTFIVQAIKGEPLSINDPSSEVDLLYIDDLVAMFLAALDGMCQSGVTIVENFPTTRTTVGEVARRIESYRAGLDTANLPEVDTTFGKQLHATYLSYLEQDARVFSLNRIASETGSFCELFKAEAYGQVSVLTIEPGAIRGTHFHDTKCENFHLARGVVDLIEYDIRGGETGTRTIAAGQSFWTRPGWVHTLKNTGDTTAVLVIWANERFDHDRPDTYRPDAIRRHDMVIPPANSGGQK